MKIAALVLSGLFSISNAFAALATFGGVGLVIQTDKKKRTEIVEVRPSSPAERGGLKAGEFITAVDGLVVEGLKSDEVAELIRGEVGTHVTLAILDQTQHASREVKLQRETIQIECLFEGAYNLRYSGDGNFGTLSGNIGSRRVYWNSNGGRISYSVDGRRVNLNLGVSSGNQWQITGWIHTTYVSWTGYDALWSGYQRCILK